MVLSWLLICTAVWHLLPALATNLLSSSSIGKIRSFLRWCYAGTLIRRKLIGWAPVLDQSGQGGGPYQACFPVRAAQVLSQAADGAGEQTKSIRAAPPLNGKEAANGCYSKRQRASPALAAPRADVALGRNCGWFGGMGGPELGAGSVLRPLIPALTPRKPTHPAPLPQHGYAASLAAPHPLLPRR